MQLTATSTTSISPPQFRSVLSLHERIGDGLIRPLLARDIECPIEWVGEELLRLHRSLLNDALDDAGDALRWRIELAKAYDEPAAEQAWTAELALLERLAASLSAESSKVAA